MLRITITGLRQTIFLSLLRTSDCRNKKIVWKKKSASNPRKNFALNNEKNAVFTAERYSVFAEEAIQFTVNGRNILMERKRKKRGKRESPKLHDERCQSLPPE
ncbi:hypothetical protein TNCV_1872661 [Trichonephila clavipes]|nr:hypothetical protein TNCV_1872661 [Trichonephila clavipes]